jgi:hypothetical protein
MPDKKSPTKFETVEDAGVEDAGVEDAGVEDAGVEDAGVEGETVEVGVVEGFTPIAAGLSTSPAKALSVAFCEAVVSAAGSYVTAGLVSAPTLS